MLLNRLATILLLTVLTVKADLINDKIINLIDQESYNLHKSLIDDITKDKDFLQEDKKIAYNSLLKSLKEEGLLSLDLPEQTNVTILFNITNSNKKGFKIIKNVLSNIGYSYYFTDFIKNADGNLIWQIRFKSDFALDPFTFNNELSKFQSSILDIKKLSKTNWEYKIDVKNGILHTVKNVLLDETLILQMPLEAYTMSLPNGKDLLITSGKANSWIPKISFYDKELNALGTIEMDRVYEGIKVAIPKNSKYVKISDKYTLLNIKRGLSILVSNSLNN